MSLRILGTGMYFPTSFRTNDWWPAATVARWKERAETKIIGQRGKDEGKSPRQEKILDAIAQLAGDPFAGVERRPVAPEGMLASEMEVLAAQDAIARAGVKPSDIDLVLTYEAAPDFYGAPTSGILQDRLGLPRQGIATGTEAICNALPFQMAFAAGLFATGAARYGLLVQCSNMSRMCLPDDPVSAWFGDAAVAFVVGPGDNFLAHAHFVDGSLNRGLVAGIPERPWYEEGRVRLYSEDRKQGRRMLLSVGDWAAEAVGCALQKAGIEGSAVDFFASHQATKWFRPLAQQFAGLERAKSFDTFPWTGSLGACNLGAQLVFGEREGILRSGDVVATFSGGGGITYSSMIYRWG